MEEMKVKYIPLPPLCTSLFVHFTGYTLFREKMPSSAYRDGIKGQIFKNKYAFLSVFTLQFKLIPEN